MKKIFMIITMTTISLVNIFANEEIFISLERKHLPFISLPANTSVITKEEIKNFNVSTLGQVLNLKKGIFVKDILNNNKPTLDLRGFGDTGNSNVLVLVNGFRMNNIDMSATDLSQIPISEIEKIEIIYGGGSVLYGDNAVGGVINIITKKVDKQVFEVRTQFNTFLTMDINATFSQVLKENFGLKLNVNSSNFNGFRENNSYAANNINLFFNTKLASNLNIDFRTDFYKDSYGLPGSVKEIDYINNNIRTSNTPQDSGATVYSVNSQILTSKKFDENKSVNVEYNYKTSLVESNWPSFGLFAFYDTRNTNTHQLITRYFQDLDLLNTNNNLSIGIDLFNSEYKVIQYLEKERQNKTQETTVSRISFAGYLYDKIYLLDNTGITFGYRAEDVANNFVNNTASKQYDLKSFINSYETSLWWVYKQKLNLSLNYSNSYRLPKTDEYFDVWTGLNDKLKTQFAKQVSLNTKYLLSPKYTFMLTLFNMNTENELFYDPINFANSNYDSTIRQGLEFETSLKPITLIDTNISYSYTKSKFDKGVFNDFEIPSVPQNILNWYLKFNFNESLTLNFFTKYVGERKFMNDIDGKYGKLDSYVVTDTKLNYNKNNFFISFAIGNIFDTKYSPVGAVGFLGKKVYYPGLPRNYSVEVSYKF